MAVLVHQVDQHQSSNQHRPRFWKVTVALRSLLHYYIVCSLSNAMTFRCFFSDLSVQKCADTANTFHINSWNYSYICGLYIYGRDWSMEYLFFCVLNLSKFKHGHLMPFYVWKCLYMLFYLKTLETGANVPDVTTWISSDTQWFSAENTQITEWISKNLASRSVISLFCLSVG